MEVKEAIAATKAYVSDIYADENVSNIGLEEVMHDDARDQWKITVGFSRPWPAPRTRTLEILEGLGAASASRQSYKTLLPSSDGRVLSMVNREGVDVAG